MNVRILVAVLSVGLLAACDRTSIRKPSDTSLAATTMGPHSVSGGVQFTLEAPDAASVHLAGSFNDWSPTADPMVRDASGNWSIVKALAPGIHNYKFAINGGQEWMADPHGPGESDDGFGGHNSVVTVTAAGTVEQAAVAGAVAGAAAVGATALTAAGGPAKVDSGWLFSIDLVSAQSVHLAGTFNNWSTSADPLTRNEEGLWMLIKSLDSGSYQYKFVVNGGQEWKVDPSNPNTADDGYGGNNSLLVVP